MKREEERFYKEITALLFLFIHTTSILMLLHTTDETKQYRNDVNVLIIYMNNLTSKAEKVSILYREANENLFRCRYDRYTYRHI